MVTIPVRVTRVEDRLDAHEEEHEKAVERRQFWIRTTVSSVLGALIAAALKLR